MGQTRMGVTPTETRRFDVDRPKDWQPSIRSQDEVDDLWWDQMLNKGQRAANTALDFFTGSTPQEEAQIGLESVINPMAVWSPKSLIKKGIARRGDPTILYHGTPSRGFEPTRRNPLGELDLKRAKESGAQGPGVYLSNEEAFSSAWGGGPPRPGAHGGSLYEVALDASPEDLIDLNKRIKEQSPKVQEALQGLIADRNFGLGWRPSQKDTKILRGLGVPGSTYGRGRQDWRVVPQGQNPFGDYGEKISLGGEGVKDYVIWDPERLDILRKLFSGVGAVGAASQLPED